MSEQGNFLGANPIYEDVDGAPFLIGQAVKVVKVDESTYGLFGRVGTVVYYEYECGCGQTFPEDPMIGVRFEDGDREEFWAEELEGK